MTTPQNKTDQSAGDREIVVSRLVDAPRELVFDAFTDTRHISNWWGPHGFSTTTHEMDLRPGGVWRFTMHGPDGRDYQNKVTYTEVARPECLAYRHAGEGDTDEIRFDVIVTFAERAGKTELTLRMIFATPAERSHVEKFGAVEGGHQTLERLARLLEKPS